MSKLQKIAAQLDALYASDESAPRLWQEKDQLKKDLRQQVRKIVYPLKLKDWTQIPNRVEEYAIKQYAKW
jgi:type I restriction enzyme R subunit